MKRLPLVIVLASTMIVLVCLAAWAQTTKTVTGQIQPFVIDIAQAVPVEVSVPISGTDGVTMTLPLTVTVNLRVSVDSASRTATVETLSAPTPEVEIETDTEESSTDNELKAPKSDGFFTVGTEIAPGTWESNGSGDSCYWARLDDQQEEIANHFGLAGGSVTILPTDYEVVFRDCGTWTLVK